MGNQENEPSAYSPLGENDEIATELAEQAREANTTPDAYLRSGLVMLTQSFMSNLTTGEHPEIRSARLDNDKKNNEWARLKEKWQFFIGIFVSMGVLSGSVSLILLHGVFGVTVDDRIVSHCYKAIAFVVGGILGYSIRK
jgi:hypothetical protein